MKKRATRRAQRLAAVHGASAPEGAIDGSFAAHLQQANTNLVATFNQVPAVVVDEVADAIIKGRQVSFLGYRANRHFAAYLRWQLVQLVERTQILPGPGETLGEYATDWHDDDVLVVFVLRRSVPLVAAFAARAHRAGAQMLYVTDHFSKQAVLARWLVRCHTQARGPLDNHVAPMLLSHLLATRLMQFAGAKGRRRMAAIEAEHDALASCGSDGSADPRNHHAAASAEPSNLHMLCHRISIGRSFALIRASSTPGSRFSSFDSRRSHLADIAGPIGRRSHESWSWTCLPTAAFSRTTRRRVAPRTAFWKKRRYYRGAVSTFFC